MNKPRLIPALTHTGSVSRTAAVPDIRGILFEEIRYGFYFDEFEVLHFTEDAVGKFAADEAAWSSARVLNVRVCLAVGRDTTVWTLYAVAILFVVFRAVGEPGG